MTVDVNKLSDEQVKKLGEKINAEMQKIIQEAEAKASKLVEPYGMDFKMVVTIGVKPKE